MGFTVPEVRGSGKAAGRGPVFPDGGDDARGANGVGGFDTGSSGVAARGAEVRGASGVVGLETGISGVAAGGAEARGAIGVGGLDTGSSGVAAGGRALRAGAGGLGIEGRAANGVGGFDTGSSAGADFASRTAAVEALLAWASAVEPAAAVRSRSTGADAGTFTSGATGGAAACALLCAGAGPPGWEAGVATTDAAPAGVAVWGRCCGASSALAGAVSGNGAPAPTSHASASSFADW
jgi:hypothetical protein